MASAGGINKKKWASSMVFQTRTKKKRPVDSRVIRKEQKGEGENKELTLIG